MSTWDEERDAAKALYATATPEQIAKVGEIINHAEQNYNTDGWDLVVETWERYEVFEVLLSAGNDVPMAIRELKRRIKPMSDFRADIQAEADY